RTQEPPRAGFRSGTAEIRPWWRVSFILLRKEDMTMRTYDFSPLFRYSVGFDRMQRLLDSALERSDSAPGYPPYNIETIGENAYRITMAVAGFGEDDLDVTVKENQLTIAGRADKKDEEVSYLHRGIATRAFE